MNQQCLVENFECNLSAVGYDGYTHQLLHQRVDEHKSHSSSIVKHFRDIPCFPRKDLS